MRSFPLALLTAGVCLAATGMLNSQTAARTVWDGVYTEEQATRGAAAAAQHCAPCHGPSLAGAEGPSLTGVEFNSNWNGLSVGDLFERVRLSMPPDDPGKVTTQEKVDVLAHILRAAGFPAGSAELPRDAQALKQIEYRAARP